MGSLSDFVGGGGGGFVLLASADISNAATVDFTVFDSTKYDSYDFAFSNVMSVEEEEAFLMRTSSDGGVSYDSSVSDYISTGIGLNPTNATEMTVAVGADLGAGQDGSSGILHLHGPHLARKTLMSVHSTTFLENEDIQTSGFAGCRNAQSDVNAVRFFMGSGNIASGVIKMYGKVKS